jgi:hypothetical protein
MSTRADQEDQQAKRMRADAEKLRRKGTKDSYALAKEMDRRANEHASRARRWRDGEARMSRPAGGRIWRIIAGR